ncbi:hypothetical protein IWZ01DRAFT_503120, partial [Phyllosticta capitalensis]
MQCDARLKELTVGFTVGRPCLLLSCCAFFIALSRFSVLDRPLSFLHFFPSPTLPVFHVLFVSLGVCLFFVDWAVVGSESVCVRGYV